MKLNEELLKEILSHLDELDYVKPEQIPDIPLYMDQLTTFMDERLEKSKRYPQDKVLTKTMINNYAKNNLLPPPAKKKYTKEHTLLLIFIYYFKNMLSFHDIETLFNPVTEIHFHTDSPQPGADSAGCSLEDIYRQICSMEKEQMRRLKEDLLRKFRAAQETFQDLEPLGGTTGRESGFQTQPDRDDLQLFSFICALGFDVYLKKQLMERLIDQIREEHPVNSKKKK